jgi:hypothetical protein
MSEEQIGAWATRKGFGASRGGYIQGDVKRNVRETLEALVRNSEIADFSVIKVR